jgi:hypothetical protein
MVKRHLDAGAVNEFWSYLDDFMLLKTPSLYQGVMCGNMLKRFTILFFFSLFFLTLLFTHQGDALTVCDPYDECILQLQCTSQDLL